MRKSDVETYDGLPSVNVKVAMPWGVELAEIVRQVGAEDGYTWEEGFDYEFVNETLNDQDHWFWTACEYEFEYFTEWAKEILPGSRYELRGRSGGHLVATNLGDVAEWDAVALAKWAKVARIAREIADGIPYQMVSLVAINIFAPWLEEQAERHAAADEMLGTYA